MDGKVTEVTPILESNDADLFASSFPVGVTVHDQRDKTRWRFREDGTKEILPDPRRELENARAAANDPSAMIGLGVIGVLVARAVGYAILRNRREEHTSNAAWGGDANYCNPRRAAG